jgi:hypothetical protein
MVAPTAQTRLTKVMTIKRFRDNDQDLKRASGDMAVRAREMKVHDG